MQLTPVLKIQKWDRDYPKDWPDNWQEQENFKPEGWIHIHFDDGRCPPQDPRVENHRKWKWLFGILDGYYLIGINSNMMSSSGTYEVVMTNDDAYVKKLD